MKAWRFAACVLVVVVVVPARATVATAASAVPTKTFALIVGVNRSTDPNIAPLRYADDDAVRYRDLFRAVGGRTVTLASLDDNTRRIHPDAALDVAPARLELLTSAVERLAREAAQARRTGARVAFYFVYAGHGRIQSDGGGSIALEDAELGGGDLVTGVIDKIAADETHVIVDACHSYFLVLGRGPGGSRRPMGGFVQLGALAKRGDVGLLLSTSSARESHEWAAYQAGVFSQEVRSGLYGAADADGDGLVSYAEIGAFVDRANAAIRNERYRPELYARPPASGHALIDLRAALARRIEVAPGGGHQFIEDTAGVRHADFHNDAPVRLVRPGEGRLYLRRKSDDREIVLPPEIAVLNTAKLPLQEPRSSVRDAANDAFASLFAMPFGTSVVSTYAFRDEPVVTASASPPDARSQWPRLGTVVGWGLAAGGVASSVWGAATLLEARSVHDGADPTSQRQADQLNGRIDSLNGRGATLLGVGIVSLAGGVLLLLVQETAAESGVAGQARRPSQTFWNVAMSADAVMGGVRGAF
jgi:caspase domain-containing protein